MRICQSAASVDLADVRIAKTVAIRYQMDTWKPLKLLGTAPPPGNRSPVEAIEDFQTCVSLFMRYNSNQQANTL